MQDQDRGYFVRLEEPPRGEKTPRGRRATVEEPADEPVRRRRRRFRVSPVLVVLLIVGGWYAWAWTTEGGPSARAQSAVDKVRELLFDATSDPDLKRASTYFNETFASQGSYPKLSAEDASSSIGISVEVVYCSPSAIVLRALTGSGTVSRLLVSGRDLGDVQGAQPCPTDMTNPLPWKVS